MAFTANQLLSYSDLQTLVLTEDYYVKNNFDVSPELVTKTQILDALWLDGVDPLSSYQSNEHVRYGDISPLGTAWVGDIYECVEDNPDSPPTAPTIYSTLVSSDRIEVSWGNSPGTDDNQIDWYIIEMALDDGNFNWGNSHTIQDILLGPKKYLYTGLTPGEDYIFRVSAIDNIGQSSPWSNTLQESTTPAAPASPAYLTVVESGTSNGFLHCNIHSDNIGTTYTVEITVSSAGTTTDYHDWKYFTSVAEQSQEILIDGSVDTSHPSTVSASGTTGASAYEPYIIVSGQCYRTGGTVGFYGWANATIKIIASNDPNGFDTTAHPFNIAGNNSGH